MLLRYQLNRLDLQVYELYYKIIMNCISEELWQKINWRWDFVILSPWVKRSLMA